MALNRVRHPDGAIGGISRRSLLKGVTALTAAAASAPWVPASASGQTILAYVGTYSNHGARCRGLSRAFSFRYSKAMQLPPRGHLRTIMLLRVRTRERLLLGDRINEACRPYRDPRSYA